MALNHEITETAEGLIILRKLLDVPCMAYRDAFSASLERLLNLLTRT